MVTPLLSIRIPQEYHDIIKRIAGAIRTNPAIIPHLDNTLDNSHHSVDNRSDDNLPLNDIRNVVNSLLTDVRLLSERVATLEAAAPAPSATPKGPGTTGAATLDPTERDKLAQAAERHPRGASGIADSAGVDRAAVRRAIAGATLSAVNAKRLRRFLQAQ